MRSESARLFNLEAGYRLGATSACPSTSLIVGCRDRNQRAGGPALARLFFAQRGARRELRITLGELAALLACAVAEGVCSDCQISRRIRR